MKLLSLHVPLVPSFRVAVPFVSLYDIVTDLKELYCCEAGSGLYCASIIEQFEVRRIYRGGRDVQSRVFFEDGAQIGITLGSSLEDGLRGYLARGDLKTDFVFYPLGMRVPPLGSIAAGLQVYNRGNTIIAAQFVGQHLYGVEFQICNLGSLRYEADDMFSSLEHELSDDRNITGKNKND